MGIHRHSAERVCQVVRRCLARECELYGPSGGEVEADESCFGGRRKWPRGRGAAGKVPVPGPLERDAKAYTRIAEGVSRETLRQVTRTRVVPRSVSSTDGFRPYDGPLLDGFRQPPINRQECFATSKRQHLDGIENFRGYAQTRSRSYCGIGRDQFYLYSKEMGSRFGNGKAANLAALIKEIVREREPVLDQLLILFSGLAPG